MNTRRCELCGKLHGNRSGSVVIGVPRSDVDYCTHDSYNLCEACSLKVYDIIEGLKTAGVENLEKRSALDDLIQRQNAEIAKMRMCLRKANNDLYSAMKYTDKTDKSKQLTERVESAIKWIEKTEPYDMEY